MWSAPPLPDLARGATIATLHPRPLPDTDVSEKRFDRIARSRDAPVHADDPVTPGLLDWQG